MSLGTDLFSQGRDRSKYKIIGSDTTSFSEDTTRLIDTSFVRVPLDSTARIKYFKYVRKDGPHSELRDQVHPLILGYSNRVQYRILFDSSDNIVITEKLDNELLKIPTTVSFDKYLKIRNKYERKKLFYNIVAEYYKIENKDDLEKLFKNITDITIPLPFKSESIFGPPTIKLQINGVIDITASYQKNVTEGQTINQGDPSQNNINFKQEVQVTTKGSVGDKLTIDADWNSQRTFDYENQLKLKYSGYADEVIKSIEAGNVSLETKSTLISSNQALFGIKGVFKLGPLTLTGIASQKKSEKKEENITGGSKEVEFEINAKDYSDNHYLLDTHYRPIFEEYYSKGLIQTPDYTNYLIGEVEVWAQTTVTNPQKRRGVAWIQLDSIVQSQNIVYDSTFRNFDNPIPGRKEVGYFYKLETSDYTLNKITGSITLNISTQQNGIEAIGVAYSLATQRNGVFYQYGTFENQTSSDSLVLKCIKVNNLRAPYIGNQYDTTYETAWNLKLKNFYHVSVKNLNSDPSKFSNFNISYRPASGTPTTSYADSSFLTRMKLDLRHPGEGLLNPSGADGQFDFDPIYTIDLVNGEIIFPSLKPFYKLLKSFIPDTMLTNPDSAIYYYSKTEVGSEHPSKFWLSGKAVGDASDRYQLGFNLVENSVKVFNGSVELSPGSDYTIDYISGELVILNKAVLSAGSNLKITYETNDLFQLASKTLLGTRAELQINKTSYLGFTLINLKQQTLNDKVRIGEEPTNNTIMGFDASTSFKLPLLTKLLNKFPGYSTKEESSMELKGEIAFMLPNPNTKNSKIPSDNNEPVAYIDDFEGVKKQVSLGISPTSWTLGSIPDSSTFGMNDSLLSIRRFNMNWFVNLNQPVLISDVYPNRSVASNQNKTLNPMVVRLQPDLPGQYSYIKTDDFRSNEPDIKKRWAGIFKYLNTSQSNLIDENIGAIELWMKIETDSLNDSAKMIIDLGNISEKIITSKRVEYANDRVNYHSEDKNGNGVLETGEDLGIDGMISSGEQSIFGDLDNSGDPAGDNYNWTNGSDNFDRFNGTEGNATLTGNKIDTEDLNGNSTLDVTNVYLSYELPLIADSLNNKYITGGGNLGWYQFTIPLNEFKKMIGTSDPRTVLSNVQFCRVWFSGIDKEASLKIVDFNLVGNQWQKSDKSDTSYNVSFINIEENSSIYQSPVANDVLRQNQNSTDANALSNEGSLSMTVRELFQGKGKYVKKLYTSRALDLLNYKIIKLFVNGDPSFNYTSPTDYDAAVVVRFGSDSLNYYEYRAPVHPDVRPGSPWNSLNEVTINISDLAAVKQLRDSVNIIKYVDIQNGPPGSKYGIIGNPTFTSVTQITLGIENVKNGIIAQSISGQVWFDELRVIKTNDKSGYAYKLSAALKIADFGTLNFAYSKVDPNFHSIESRFGSRTLNNFWEISGTFNAHKILNSLLSSLVSVKFKDFFTIPISFGHTESYDKPLYIPGTDIDLESAIKNLPTEKTSELISSTQTLTIQNRFSVNGFKFTFPSDNFFIKEIVNKISINYHRNSISQRSPSVATKYSWDMGGDISMNVSNSLTNKLNLSIGKFLPLGEEYANAKLYFFFPFIGLAPLYSPGLTLNTNFTRTREDGQLRNQFNPNPTSRNFNSGRGFSMDWKFIENWIFDIGGTYSFGATSDLTYLETYNDSSRTQRSNSEIFGDIFGGGGMFINFGRDQAYQQSVVINPKFNIPFIKKFFDITASYTGAYKWRPPQIGSNLGSVVDNRSDLQSSIYIKLNEFYKLFKKPEKENKGGSNTLQDGQGVGDIMKLFSTFLPEQVSVTYSQTKSNINQGVGGRAGFQNFWVNFASKNEAGPSRLYQLGWTDDPGIRVPLVRLSDGFQLTNNLNFSTQINPIFPNNLKITFNYKTSWSTNNTHGYDTDASGNLGSPINFQSDRSLSRPSFIFGGDVLKRITDIPDTNNSQLISKYISDQFETSFISFPFPNWNITLSGVEKFEMFSSFMSSMSIENAFASEYRKNFINNGSTPEYVSAQSISSGFSPLIGINMNFKPIEEGNLTASIKLSKVNNFDLNTTANQIINTKSSDISINLSYSKTGFKVPFFGLSLNNDLTITFTYQKQKNEPTTYKYEGIWDVKPSTGSISTTFNPAIQYALSKNVSIQLFYKYTKIEPNEGVEGITRKNNEAGLNFRLSIQ